MVNRNKKLEIFENFEIDRSLPKYYNGVKIELGGSLTGINSINNTAFIVQGTATTMNSWGSVVVGSIPPNNWVDEFPILKDKKIPFWKKLFTSEKKKEVNLQKIQTMTILNFFSSLAQSLNDLKGLQDIAIHYESAITNAAKAGQTALVDRLKSRLESAKSEVQLVTKGLTKYLVEEQVVDFYTKANRDKKLKLTWIKHFVKPIPSKILDIKADLDQQFVFDNYVVLHYDPSNDATDLTENEKEEVKRRQKDPILFGVIANSRRLYYVGDWIDDYCDLTLDVVLETLQEKVNEVNNDSVKTYIDRGVREEERIKLSSIQNQRAFTGSTSTYAIPINFKKVVDKIKKKGFDLVTRVIKPKKVTKKVIKKKK